MISRRSGKSTLLRAIRYLISALEQDGVTGMDMSDMSYVTSGYAPLTGRLVQAILLQGGVSAEIQKLLPVSVKEYRQEMASSLRENGMRKKVALVVLVGGMSYMEMAAIRQLKRIVGMRGA